MEEAKNQASSHFQYPTLLSMRIFSEFIYTLFAGDVAAGHQVQLRGEVPLQPVQHQPGGARDPRPVRSRPGPRQEGLERGLRSSQLPVIYLENIYLNLQFGGR